MRVFGDIEIVVSMPAPCSRDLDSRGTGQEILEQANFFFLSRFIIRGAVVVASFLGGSGMKRIWRMHVNSLI